MFVIGELFMTVGGALTLITALCGSVTAGLALWRSAAARAEQREIRIIVNGRTDRLISHVHKLNRMLMDNGVTPPEWEEEREL